MAKGMKNFYNDIEPVVIGISEYRDLLNDKESREELKKITSRIIPGTPEYHQAIEEKRKPEDDKKKELSELSKKVAVTITKNLEDGLYGNIDGRIKDLIKNRIISNLSKGEFVAMNFVVDNMKNPIQYQILKKDTNYPYGN